MNNFSDDLYPLALLMDELKHDDVSNRVEAMQNWTPLLLPWDQNEQEKNCYHFLTMLLKM